MITRREVLQKIAECEKNGQFDQHVDPIDYNNAWPVDENFHYIKKGFREKFKNAFLHTFVVLPFTWKINKKVLKSTILGRDNLKGIKSAVVTCNHVNKFDCLVVKYGLRGHKLFITAGSFNNQKGRFGDHMRAGGLMPFSDNPAAMRNFNKAMEYRLQNKSYVLFYPEQAMWWNYEKPRPYKNGAFHYAVKHQVPIIPTFITYIDTDKLDEEGIKIKKFILHIMPPIYAKPELNNRENVEYLKNKNFEMCKEVYEKFYNEKLVYTCGGPE